MSQVNVKTYRVIGEVRKPALKIPFKKTVRAVNVDDAVEKVLSEVGSKHKAKRFEVKILKTEEEKP